MKKLYSGTLTWRLRVMSTILKMQVRLMERSILSLAAAGRDLGISIPSTAGENPHMATSGLTLLGLLLPLSFELSKVDKLLIPYLIAEVSGNIENYKDVYDSISIAKNCGADCVKFQQFTTKEMYGRSGLSETNFFLDIAKIKEKADAVGIDFMVSCFSAESLRAIDPYVKAHKIASSDNPPGATRSSGEDRQKDILIHRRFRPEND
jgi:hypothetical protein